MADFVTPYLFNAHALPVDLQDSHAQPGNHLRVNHHPLLGLPVAPFIVERASLYNLKQLNVRTDARFYDEFERELIPPFDVTADNPVTARITLRPGEVCLWAQVVALSVEDAGSHDKTEKRPPVTDAKPDPGIRKPVWATGPLKQVRTSDPDGNLSPQFRLKRHFDPFIRSGDKVLKQRQRKLTCEAFIASAMGSASIGRRSHRRYAFSGPDITEIRISGWGRVTTVKWIEAQDEQKLIYQPYAILNLPHTGGSRYLPLTDAKALADARVHAQAPKRQPLQETSNTPQPAAAPQADAAFEHDRVTSLAECAQGDLELLINDLSQSQLAQSVDQRFTDENGDDVGTSSIRRLGRVMQMLPDPGTASLLGYKLYDDAFPKTEECVVFYRVHGFFEDSPSGELETARPLEQLLLDFIIASLSDQYRNRSRKQFAEQFSTLIKNNAGLSKVLGMPIDDKVLERMQDHERYFSVASVAIADCGAPLDVLRAPHLPEPKEQPPLSDNWLPATPPKALREIQVNVAGTRVGGLLAAGKLSLTETDRARYINLNKKNDQSFHLPLALGLNSEDGSAEPVNEPGGGFVADRRAGPDVIAYSIAQQDRFGRWSPWTTRHYRAGVRPRPPRPEFHAYYQQPEIADAADSGGKIQVTVMVPNRDALAPGSHLLDHLHLLRHDNINGDLVPLEANEADKRVHPADKDLAADEPRRYLLDLYWTGPVLSATEQRRLLLTAHWIDTGGNLSEPSTPQTLKLVDPRPPEPVRVPDTLQYTARPDVTGLCWVEHRWGLQTGQHHFAIYYTDENRLRSHLEQNDQTNILDALDNTDNAAARATLYRENSSLFPDFLFERLRDANVTFNSGEHGFRHAVSGSLRVLSFYKIAAESESGAKPMLADVPLVIYGVPNADPPPRPTLQVSPVAAEAGQTTPVAEVRISLLAGTTPGLNWRLRRSSVDTGTLAKVPIVTTGKLDDLDEDNGHQRAIYRDKGPVQIAAHARLRPWVRYSWIAEVQGAPESGSQAAGAAVPGRWSQPSDPFSLIMVPEKAPAAPTINDVSATGSGVTVTFSHPDELSGGSVGSYRLRLTRRQTDDAPMELVRDEPISGTGPFTVSDEDSNSTPVLSKTKYFVELIDPLGRTSERSWAELA